MPQDSTLRRTETALRIRAGGLGSSKVEYDEQLQHAGELMRLAHELQTLRLAIEKGMK